MPEFDHGVNVPLLRKTLEYIEEVARVLLGLPHDSLNYGSKLFDGSHDLTKLWRLAAEYTDGEIEIPDESR